MDNNANSRILQEIRDQLDGMEDRFRQWRLSSQKELLGIRQEMMDVLGRIEGEEKSHKQYAQSWFAELASVKDKLGLTVREGDEPAVQMQHDQELGEQIVPVPGGQKKGVKIRKAAPTAKSNPSVPRKSGRLGCFIVFILVIAFIAVAVVGSVAGYRVFTQLWDDLPNRQQIEITSRALQLILNKDKGTIDEVAVVNTVQVRLEQIPPFVSQAFIAIEDQRFFKHQGLDPIGMVSSLVRSVVQGRRLGGGSTISQQTVKNLFFNSSRSVFRKIKESVLSLKLEYYFSKNEILQMYLNNAYFGETIYGIEAAAQNYFSKHASELNLMESALLAAAVKGPNYYHPQKHLERSRLRARLVLDKMVEQKFITRKEMEDGLKAGIAKGKLTWQPVQHQFLRDWIIPELTTLLGNYEGRFRVMTTMVPGIQHEARYALRAQLRKAQSRQVEQGAIVALARDGAVLAMQGGVDFSESQLNRCTQALRSPGSALKTFLYLTALERGMTASTVVDDSPVEIDDWSPNNFDNDYMGEMSLEEAFILSRNTVAVKILEEIGIETYQQRLHQLGLERQMPANFTLALGTGEMTMLELASLYAVLAGDGFKVTPYAIYGIMDMQGELLYWREASRSKRLVEPEFLKKIKGLLAKVVSSGTGRRAAFGKQPVYGKTGTSQNFRDAWFVGFSGGLTTAVWLGNDDNSPMDEITGGSLPAGIWKKFMEKSAQP